MTRSKREGDGATPAGSFRLLALYFRADRVPRPRTQVPTAPIHIDDGWCDDPNFPCYNRAVRLPFGGSHERMWRGDGHYDYVLVLDYNVAPARKRRGSAIFFHVAAPEMTPTAGCIAVRRDYIRRLLDRIGPRTRIEIGAS